MNQIAQYTHNCPKCTFLGSYLEQAQSFDLYFCPQGTLPTVIARFGDKGQEYLSGLAVAKAIATQDPSHPLVEAARRAQNVGFIS
jgi:hypothetical protein